MAAKKQRLIEQVRVLLKDAVNGQLLIRDVPAGNHGSCIHHLGLDIYFDEYNYLDSLQVHLTEELATQFVSIV